MATNDFMGLEVICVIVNYGQASKLIKTAKEHGITGTTIFLGKGTIQNAVLEFLGLTEVRKEIALLIGGKDIVNVALEKLNEKFSFDKPNHGIAFTMSVQNLFGANGLSYEGNQVYRGVVGALYKAIFVIVDRGKAELVVEAANKGGSRGATIINARGSGIHETSKLFSIDIEPEKEVVLIISEDGVTDSIISSVRDHLKIDEPGNGIIFVQDVNKTYGLRSGA